MATRLVVRKTFLDLEAHGPGDDVPGRGLPRCRSAPELWTATAELARDAEEAPPAVDACLGRTGKRRRWEADGNDAAMEESDEAARLSRWATWAVRIGAADRCRALEVAREAAALRRQQHADPRLRCEMSLALFLELAHVAFEQERRLTLLAELGVLRLGRGSVQMWISDRALRDPAARDLLGLAEHFLRVAHDSLFQVYVRGDRGPMVLRWTTCRTRHDLEIVLAAQGFPPSTYSLHHMRRELGPGQLAGNGIAPGSAIVLEPLTWQRI
jgi:hypothetical protein